VVVVLRRWVALILVAVPALGEHFFLSLAAEVLRAEQVAGVRSVDRGQTAKAMSDIVRFTDPRGWLSDGRFRFCASARRGSASLTKRLEIQPAGLSCFR